MADKNNVEHGWGGLQEALEQYWYGPNGKPKPPVKERVAATLAEIVVWALVLLLLAGVGAGVAWLWLLVLG